ncbi:TetR/AcrR family transcriptional regulator [Streptomyces uncialis]|uniref:TetR/AcrR family transcriptional regulator n=1 Tax=Streptomyces uncialis TaxID=1048205 RepID=UPI002E32F977|nr:TetR/AcrR family transcriptional regulator [Streptomyces uncialis]WST67993.1 TetR/AcrR family transcriptional regulator [Streptomyces uncialis]
MGHREDLLEGAKRCLLEKGFTRTTARDIVKESGTNLASIGYHYGSKDALLAQAYVAMIGAVGDAFEGLGEDRVPDGDGSLERFEKTWENVIHTFSRDRRIWRLSLEVSFLGDGLPGVREHLAAATGSARTGLMPLFVGGPEPDPDDPAARSQGAFYVTLLQGLLVQWLFDPATAPSAKELTEGLRRVIADAGGVPDTAADPGTGALADVDTTADPDTAARTTDTGGA